MYMVFGAHVNKLCTRGDSEHYISGDEDTMVSHCGTITEFSGIAEDWDAYVEQLESYFVASDITTAAKKHAVLLSSCGTSTYKTIRSVVAPEKPTEVSYADLIKKL